MSIQQGLAVLAFTAFDRFAVQAAVRAAPAVEVVIAGTLVEIAIPAPTLEHVVIIATGQCIGPEPGGETTLSDP